MSIATSPTRRVLGLKNPNAPLRQQPSKIPDQVLQVTSLISQRAPAKRSFSPATSPLTSPRIGQKRKIEEVHDAERTESQETHPLSQVIDLLSDTQSDIGDSAQTSMAQSKSTLDTTFSSFCASQEEHPQVESEFDILEEPSQQTLDQMHDVSFTQNASQLVPPLRPNLVKEASQISLSMSSLIDFENNRSTQDDDLQMMEESEAIAPEETRKTEDNARKEMMLEKAETLRTRLQLAFYKIQTNQVTSPFARLQVPKLISTSPDLLLQSSSPKSSSTLRLDSVQEKSASPESRVALARARATAGPRPTVRALSTLPMPRIAPTTFSARWSHESHANQERRSSQTEPGTMPSSPPLSQLDGVAENSLTRATHSSMEPRTPMQWSNPVAGDREDESDENVNLRRKQLRPRALTSSVVKGEAANSLLELVRGTRSG